MYLRNVSNSKQGQLLFVCFDCVLVKQQWRHQMAGSSPRCSDGVMWGLGVLLIVHEHRGKAVGGPAPNGVSSCTRGPPLSQHHEVPFERRLWSSPSSPRSSAVKIALCVSDSALSLRCSPGPLFYILYCYLFEWALYDEPVYFIFHILLIFVAVSTCCDPILISFHLKLFRCYGFKCKASNVLWFLVKNRRPSHVCFFKTLCQHSLWWMTCRYHTLFSAPCSL